MGTYKKWKHIEVTLVHSRCVVTQETKVLPDHPDNNNLIWTLLQIKKGHKVTHFRVS